MKTPHLLVMEPGLCTTIQDLGRYGYQAMGVPVSGGRDSISLRISNALAANPETYEGLEISLQGPLLKVMADSVRLVLGGTDNGHIEIIEPHQPAIPSWQSVRLEEGTLFRINGITDTFGGFLAITGGLAIPSVLGSKSTFLLGGLGGLNGRQLRKDDKLPLKNNSARIRKEQALNRPLLHFSGVPDDIIRVIPGPQDDYFKPESIKTFFNQPYQISLQSDRVGFRLEGPRLIHAKGFNIVSDGITTGAIQVPGNGLPIILFNDHQLTGGYPKIAHIISADLPKLGRLKPLQKIRFRAVTIEEAEDIRRTQETELHALLSRLPAVTGQDNMTNRPFFNRLFRKWYQTISEMTSSGNYRK
ncbi:MAG: allophanate hydrolase [Proteobacteria bacterium]|nr:MAG: allophanate hydrolase [Pseudomonadota bacterium]PIE64755.1 MAG: allophanate hydrolase [Desulfobacterales bacterium]